jgi:hypothetical protein
MKAYRLSGYSNVIPTDQSYYDVHLGGVHCGTNFIRAIPTDKWWTQ